MSEFEVDEATQLKTVEATLVRRFGDRLPQTRISSELNKAIHRFDKAKVRAFVPNLVQREVVDTLRHAT